MAASNSLSARTALEYAGILLILYLYFGSPSQPSTTTKSIHQDDEHTLVSQDRIESVVYPDRNLQCPEHKYDVHIFSRSPLILYIPNFVSEQEADHLIELSANNWTPSTIFTGPSESTDTSVRKSEKALIPRDTTVQCLEARALAFQGWPRHTFIERLWTQRYNVSGHYAHHYDWNSESAIARRSSTFMVYLSADCEGGGTHFPLLTRPSDERWCEFVDCGKSDAGGDGEEGVGGVTFLPRAGAAVFWENFDSEGRGWKEGLHAGMPVLSGTKIGLNIWSWYQMGHEAPADVEPAGKSEL